MEELTKRFEYEMRQIYVKAGKECNYWPTRFLQLIDSQGAIVAARYLISKTGGTEGFTKLWELKRLDLSAEVLILQPEFSDLFTDEERDICRQRLNQYGYEL